jgi:hypothetical protein
MDKAQLFALVKSDVKEIEIAALGAIKLKFRVLTGKARDLFHTTVKAGDGTASHFEAAIAAATVVDDNHEAMFTQEDVAALQDANAGALSEIAKAAMDVNKIGAVAEDAAAKN